MPRRYFEEHQILSSSVPHSLVRYEEVAAWLDGEGKRITDIFLERLSGLKQGKRIPKSRARAFIWSFFHDPGIMAMDPSERRRWQMGMMSGLTRLSAYDLGVVAREFDGSEPAWSFKSAEQIRRGLLLKDVFSMFRASPDSRLRKYARPDMERACWEAVQEASERLPGYRMAQAMGKNPETPLISAFGDRYLFIKREFDDREDVIPCILLVEDDEDKRGEYAWELGALAAIADSPACVICGIHPRDYAVSAAVVEERDFARQKEAAIPAAIRFWKEHVLPDVPLPPRTCERGDLDLPGEALDRYAALAKRLVILSQLKKKAEEQEKAVRSAMHELVRGSARALGGDLSDMRLERIGACSPQKGWRVQEDELQYLVDHVPGAGEAVFSKVKADPEKMEAKLREIGVDERLYCHGVPDTAKILEYCRNENFSIPLRPTLIFKVGGRSGEARADLDRAAAEAERIVLEAQGL